MHLQNMAHRDLKPENIMCVTDSKDDPRIFQIRICDFGFAQLI
jgi:serine/threonine protein kinase